MLRRESAFLLVLTITGFSLCYSSHDFEVVGQRENILTETWNGNDDSEVNTVLFQDEDLEPHPTIVPTTGGYFPRGNEDVKEKETDNNGDDSSRRARRQAQTTITLLDSVSQECDGITLRWNKPNIPFSLIFHNDNPEFSHYNIYRETSYFSSVAGLTPIISGKYIQKLRKLATDKWFDKFPPTSTGLFYAVTVVDHKGKETQNVVPKQITFYGSIEKEVLKNPVRIIPSLLKGDVLHHSLAYNHFRNEYMVAFDLDVNKDGKPDHVFAVRVNGLGQIVDRRVLNATAGIASTEQGRPSVAFNPTTRQYLIAFQLSAPSLFQGFSLIIGQRVFAHKTDRFQNPYVLVKATSDGITRIPVIEPKLIYNSGSGGFAMSVMIVKPPKTAFAVFIKGDGQAVSIQPMFKGEVFDVNLFMDTKAQQVYFIFQVAQWAVTITSGKNDQLNSHPYFILAAKANATGSWLTLSDPKSIRYLIGFTSEKHANIAGYLHKKGWLKVFWNNKENGKQVITSSIIIGLPGIFLREGTVSICSSPTNARNPASCFLPTNNGHILLWEQGSRIGGYLVKDDTFAPVLGEQQRPQLVYNEQVQRAFVVWKEKTGGNFILFVRNINPGSKFTCSPSCQSTMKCAMKNVCAPRNPGIHKTFLNCAKNKGGCSHTCIKSGNRQKCSCPIAYTLALDEMKCYAKGEKPDVSLLYSTKGSVWSVSIYYQSKRTTYTKIPIQGQNIISFAYNKKDKYLYWADSTEEKIYRAFLDGTNKQILIQSQVLLVDGMIVDPDAKQLYWTDTILGVIFRCSLDGSNKIVFVSSLDKPRALALHQQNKWLYWTSWGGVAKIERINTDGSNRQVLISSGLVWPNGLAVTGSTLYWADAKQHTMETSDLNGQNRVAITKGLAHPFGLDIAGTKLFWSDWSGDIRMLDKNNPSNVQIIVTGVKKPFGLQVYDGTAVVIAKFCMDPGVPTNGGRNPSPDSNGKYKVSNRIVLTCNPGFVHLGSNNRECLPTGKWTGADTQCKARPIFTEIPTNTTTDSSNSITLSCSAQSSPGVKAKIQWYKDGKVLPPSVDGRYFQISSSGSLFFVDTVVADTGTYMCVARNDAGDVRASMFLRVKDRNAVIDCGLAKFKRIVKIIGGTRATRGSIPWQVMLFNKKTKKPFCGGTLLNSKWIITAAHCLSNLPLSHIEVRLGEHNYLKAEKSEQILSVDKIHQHPHYDLSTFDSDIGLVKFTTGAVMTDYVKPICLPTKSAQNLLKPKSHGTISGWGAKNTKNNKFKPVKTLHRVTVPLVSDIVCKNSNSYLVTANMFCAGVSNGTADACKGDSGGPLTVKKNGRSVLIGIVSWGDNCGAKNKYGVYTKVQNYIAWIMSIIRDV